MPVITVMLKNGGYEKVICPPEFIGQLAESIFSKGSKYLTLKKRAIEVVGFLVIGNQTGERIIMLGSKELKDIESTETA